MASRWMPPNEALPVRIAFHAPLKPPDASKPSGDRRMARLFIKAMKAKGHDVQLASRLRTRDGLGDPKLQARLQRTGGRLANRLIRRYKADGAWRPDIWFTYHLYYKAPDWIGPIVAEALNIPYVVAEASHAPKRANGPWKLGHRQVESALRRADLVIGLNQRDRACVEHVLGSHSRYAGLRPFLEPRKQADRSTARGEIADRHALPTNTVWLLTVGMMRAGAKLESYRVLAAALARLEDKARWRLIVIGDGPVRPLVEEALGLDTIFTGALPGEQLADYYAASDIFVWPSVREAYGMALLEAQTVGLPAVAGDSGGVSGILRDGETGLLCAEGDVAAFTAAVERLITDDRVRLEMGQKARAVTALDHGFRAAANTIDRWLNEMLGVSGKDR
jgi:glycosyltransferase involved in cell wall biosynthesis